MPTSARVLIVALFALAALFAAWFAPRPTQWDELVVFALPPLLLAIARWRGRRTAAFWASVLALGWFSHGVMVAWSRPAEAGYAWGEIALALAVIFAANLPGLRARFGKRRA
ncbi:DUF2069 domain-containing protein [Cognatilysobacter bugurensis]|uniref:Membrane protein n=1 Tax=Cognatilysobacter bugurensis TaxID=543356 RepID=A0A918WAK6_9GAMM|nr:DUF2069 domain-containing protein [Lysobacter bugurensis]GHA89580.1 membrane protein [Lysobacter bugurensis]